MPFTCSLRGTKTSHYIYLYLKFELYLTHLIVGHILVHYCLLYKKFTLSLSVPTNSRFIFLKSLLNLKGQIISNLMHAYTQVNME